MRPSFLATVCLASASLAGASDATLAHENGTGTPRQLAPRAALTDAAAAVAIDGVPTGFGRLYKARFEPGRFSFLPALGRSAARDESLVFELESIRRGGVLVHACDRPVSAELQGERVAFARGASIDERYDIAAAGVHQSFLFHEPLPGAGELVVRGRLSTALVPEPAADGSLLFRRDGRPAVRWGAVRGLDTAGRGVAGELRCDGTALELVLPGAFVDQATFPLLLDPLIGTEIAVEDSTSVDSSPDVARGDLNRLVVWERTFSLLHGEVYGQLLDSNGDLDGALIPISTGNDIVAREPSAGYVAASDVFFVAWTFAPNIFTSPQIRCASVDDLLGTVTPATTVSPTGTTQVSPDVGGDDTGSDDEAFVVWNEVGVGVRGRTLQAREDLAPLPQGAPFTIDAHTATIEPVRPRISKSVAEGLDFLVVWQRIGTNAFVRGRLYDRNGVAQGAGFDIHGNQFLQNENPDCDGDGDAFVVVWQVSEALATPDVFDVVCRPLEWTGSQVILRPTRTVEADANDDETLPTVALTDSGAIVAYLDEDGSSTNVYLKNVDPFNGVAVGEVNLASGASASAASVVATVQDDVLVVWDDAGDVFGQRYDAVGTNFDEGGGCGNGGEAVIANALAGNADFRIHLRGAEAGVLAACVTGLAELPVGCGLCTLVPNLENVAYDTTDPRGNASVLIPLAASFGGLEFWSQWVTFVPVGACPLAPLDFAHAKRTIIDSNP